MAHYHNNNHHHHLTISLNLVNLRCRYSVKFSLSGRDDDSNRFLSSWRGIPNTHPIHLINGFLESPLVQLRNRGSEQRRTLRESTLPGGQSHLWTYANSSPHILTTTRVRTFTSRTIRPELSYLTSRSEQVIRPTK